MPSATTRLLPLSVFTEFPYVEVGTEQADHASSTRSTSYASTLHSHSPSTSPPPSPSLSSSSSSSSSVPRGSSLSQLAVGGGKQIEDEEKRIEVHFEEIKCTRDLDSEEKEGGAHCSDGVHVVCCLAGEVAAIQGEALREAAEDDPQLAALWRWLLSQAEASRTVTVT